MNESKHREDRNNIYLTGFMGCGKTSTGKLLAERLSMEFYDTDSIVEESSGRNISEIFEIQGEEYFRNMESVAVADVSRRADSVVALGGGAVLNPENLSNLRRSGVLIYLKLSPRELALRLSGVNSRPLLAGLSGNALIIRIEEVLTERRSVYESADIAVECSALSKEEIVDEIIRKILR